jgi:predicted AAA+ superfamily ATPase
MIAIKIVCRLQANLERRLQHFPAVALLGGHQVGKTTLARLVADARNGLYLDLENPADLETLSDAGGCLAAQRGRLAVIGEVQRAPSLFQAIRGLIDERVRDGEPAGHSLVLGSAPIDLLRQSSESLEGRIACLVLSP